MLPFVGSTTLITNDTTRSEFKAAKAEHLFDDYNY
jgi:hypothetical protein